jgi:hypothetical protein
VHMIGLIKEMISWLKEKANRVKAKLLRVGHNHPTKGTDADAQQLVHLEAGARGLREDITKASCLGWKEAKEELLENFGRYMSKWPS